MAFLILLPNIINKFIFDYDSQKQVLGNNKVNHLDKNGILFFFLKKVQQPISQVLAESKNKYIPK